jgi:hypothetical protein
MGGGNMDEGKLMEEVCVKQFSHAIAKS